MTDAEYLTANGWTHDPGEHVHQWRDPKGLASRYTLKDAVATQRYRDTPSYVIISIPADD